MSALFSSFVHLSALRQGQKSGMKLNELLEPCPKGDFNSESGLCSYAIIHALSIICSPSSMPQSDVVIAALFA